MEIPLLFLISLCAYYFMNQWHLKCLISYSTQAGDSKPSNPNRREINQIFKSADKMGINYLNCKQSDCEDFVNRILSQDNAYVLRYSTKQLNAKEIQYKYTGDYLEYLAKFTEQQSQYYSNNGLFAKFIMTTSYSSHYKKNIKALSDQSDIYIVVEQVEDLEISKLKQLSDAFIGVPVCTIYISNVQKYNQLLEAGIKAKQIICQSKPKANNKKKRNSKDRQAQLNPTLPTDSFEYQATYYIEGIEAL